MKETKHTSRRPPAVVIFTPDEVSLLQTTVKALEKRLHLLDTMLPNRDFASEVVQGLHAKLSAMLKQQGKVWLDQNEIVLLKTAVYLYTIGLTELQATTGVGESLKKYQDLTAKLQRITH